MRNATMFSALWSAACEAAANDAEETAADRAVDPAAGDALTQNKPRARRGYSLLKGRRTRFQAKRRTGQLTADTPVHRDEREIIARN